MHLMPEMLWKDFKIIPIKSTASLFRMLIGPHFWSAYFHITSWTPLPITLKQLFAKNKAMHGIIILQRTLSDLSLLRVLFLFIIRL